MSLLTVEHISKSFGGIKAVSDFSFQVGKGQIVSIIGPNGAGKTTVFNLLTGIYRPDTGSIRLDGEELVGLKPYQLIENGVARTFQNLRLFSELTVLENVMIGYQSRIHYSLWDSLLVTKKKRQGEAQAEDRAREIIERIGLSHQIDNDCKNLPYGMQKKVEIARAMVSEVKLVLLDEPAADLNPSETAEMSDFIQRLKEWGYTVLLIEHDMNLVMKISDYIYVMNYGAELAGGLPAEIRSNPQVIEAYIGKGGVQRVLKSGFLPLSGQALAAGGGEALAGLAGLRRFASRPVRASPGHQRGQGTGRKQSSDLPRLSDRRGRRSARFPDRRQRSGRNTLHLPFQRPRRRPYTTENQGWSRPG